MQNCSLESNPRDRIRAPTNCLRRKARSSKEMARSGIHFDRSFRARLFNWHVRFVEYDDSLPTHSPCRWLNGFTRKWSIYMYIWWIREILVDFAQNSINKFSFKIGFSKICSRWIREDFSWLEFVLVHRDITKIGERDFFLFFFIVDDEKQEFNDYIFMGVRLVASLHLH